MEHLASLKDACGQKILSVCTFDNRGIGASTVFKHKKDYSTLIMAYDTQALIDHLQWRRVHIVGMSMGGKKISKLACTAMKLKKNPNTLSYN